MISLLFALALPLSVAKAQSPIAAPTMQHATTAPATYFDPDRHMKVSEVRAGMKGYGLTVFSGTTIERFDVEVISLLHNAFGPQQSVVMIRCLGEKMEHFGPIAGASGSPVYLFDESGKARLVGAYAFGFDTSKEPIIGVQPIEYMMRLTKPKVPAGDLGTERAAATARSWSLLESSSWRASLRDAGAIPRVSPKRQGLPPSSHRFKPLAVPLAVSGATESALAALRPMLQSHGFEPLLAPGTAPAATGEAPKIEPGAVMGAAMLSGDLELTAMGTCTEAIDGRAFGFGHAFTGEGATSIPVGPGSVSLVIPLRTSSFKLGGLTAVTGAIDIDGAAGIAGDLGASATTVPIEVSVDEGNGQPPRQFRYRAALHRSFTPMMMAMALQASVVAGQQLPVEHTADYRVTMKFAGGREISVDNVATSLDGFDLARDSVWPVSTAMDNPVGVVAVEGVSASVKISRGVRAALIEAAAPAQPAYRPGETARINVRLRKYKGEPFMKVLEVPLPATLEDGDYAVSLSDATTSLGEDATARPDRFAIRDVDELFETMTTLVGSTRNDAIYVRLKGEEVGIAIGRTPLTKLPPSRQAMLGASGRPDVAALSDVRVTVVPMEQVITGSAEATIRVKKKLP